MKMRIELLTTSPIRAVVKNRNATADVKPTSRNRLEVWLGLKGGMAVSRNRNSSNGIATVYCQSGGARSLTSSRVGVSYSMGSTCSMGRVTRNAMHVPQNTRAIVRRPITANELA